MKIFILYARANTTVTKVKAVMYPECLNLQLLSLLSHKSMSACMLTIRHVDQSVTQPVSNILLHPFLLITTPLCLCSPQGQAGGRGGRGSAPPPPPAPASAQAPGAPAVAGAADLASAPLSTSVLVQASPEQQKQLIGERLYPEVSKLQPELAGKITGGSGCAIAMRAYVLANVS